MKAVIYDKKSSFERLTYTDVEKPTLNDNELLIEIHAASINAADYRMMQMGFPPKKKIFGADISGVVESVGKNVRKFKPGDCVIGDLSDYGFGGFAEYVAAPEKAFVHKPDQISFKDAAALPLAGTTALQALRNKGDFQKECQVLIIGSSGGVGTYAIQIAKYYGMIVTGMCSSKNEEQTRLLGADYIVDYKKEDFTQISRTYDLILAINGNYPLTACKRLLNQNGRYIMVGGALRQIFKSILFGWLMSFGSKKIGFLTAKSNIDNLEFIVKLVKEGKIKPVIDKCFNLNVTSDAIRYIKEQHAYGKIMIQVK